MAAIPGCQGIEQVSANEYRGRLQMRLPAVIGAYETYMKRVEVERPHDSRLEGMVEGDLGSIKGTVSFWLALKLRKPLLVEGEAGVGKTEIAKVLAAMLGRPLIRLQCYEGLDVNTGL